MLALSGILTGAMLIFTKIGFLQWATMVPAAFAIFSIASDKNIRLRGLYGYGFFYFMCYYPVVYHWFVNLYPLEFVDGMTPIAALAVVLAGVFGLSLLQALMGGLVFVFIGLLFRGRIAEKAPILKPFMAAGLWAVFEWTQTLGWIGVPWGRLAIGQTEYAVGIQTASLFGSYFISFLIVAVNFSIAYAILKVAEGESRKIKLPVICVAAMLVFQYGAGAVIYVSNSESGETEPIKVAAVQGNISSNEKWSLTERQRIFESYGKYTVEAAKAGVDIILWPESALPYSLEKGEYSHDFVSKLARVCGVPIIAGGFMNADDNGVEYNALVCFTPDGRVLEDFYAKRHLVPFGEYVPMEKLISVIIPPLAELVMGDCVLVAGEGAQLIEVEGISAGSLICFDSIYEELALESVRAGAEVLFISTNDSWFTDSAALNMHNAQAKLRSVETGRYTVRAANTGISSVITPRGEVTESLGALKEGYIVGEIYPKNTQTLYTVIGNFFIYLLIICFLAILIVDARYKFIKKTL